MNAHLPKKVPVLATLFMRWTAGVVSAMLLLSCAGQVPPGGGPFDTTPPTIIRTVPDTNAIRVETHSIELEFSEYVDRGSVEESVFISPYLGELEFDWSSTEVKINFSQPLRRNTTYVVNIGTDVVDVRARNRMASGYTLAFSTGDSIDQGFISGRVFDEKPEGIMIFAYSLAGIQADTLDPGHTKPDYIMQTGKSGLWTLSNIAFGAYRLFAVRDEYRNLLYDRGVDAYGVTRGDVTITAEHARVANVDIRLSREDTVKPFLSSAHAIDRYRLEAQFSEPLDSATFAGSSFLVTDTLQHRSLDVLLTFLNHSNPTAAGVLLNSRLDSAVTYLLRVQGVTDMAGNMIDTAHATATFLGTNRPDTNKVLIGVPGFRDSVRGIWIEQPVEIDFSKPVLREPLRTAVVLRDSARKPVEVDSRWMNVTDLVLFPKKPFLSSAWYQIRLTVDSVRDYRGNRAKDTTFVLRFQTIDMRTTGLIAGRVADAQAEKGKGAIYLQAASIDLTPQRKSTIILEKPGPFAMDKLVEGKYVLSAFRDTDSSGTYSYGSPFPWKPSERFVFYPDTVKVRARWNVEGVQLTLP
jgi:hypothetical protein